MTRNPGVYLHETVENIKYNTNGQVPVFIGRTNNNAPNGKEIHKYMSFKEASKSISEGGIGATGNLDQDLTTNPLLNVLQRFFQEADDISYIYVIDVNDGTKLEYWRNAINTHTVYPDIDVEVYYGVEYLDGETQQIFDIVNNALTTNAKNFMFRRAFSTILFDTEGEALTDDMLINLVSKNLTANRLRIIDPQINNTEANHTTTIDKFIIGDYMGRIISTPIGREPGYYEFKNIPVDRFPKRDPETRQKLFNAGVIFGFDEYYSESYHPRINMTVGCGFGNLPGSRPADCLDYARRIADYVLKQVYNTTYPFVKQMETKTNMVVLQTRINRLLEQDADSDLIILYDKDNNPGGSYLRLEESTEDPFNLIISGQIQSVKSIIAIDVETTITAPPLKDTRSD